MASFDINKISVSVLNNVEKIHETKNTEFYIEMINLENIHRNDKNFYDIKDIDELAEDIKLNGLQHNISVRKLEDSKYQIISGERRYTVYKKLFDEGNKLYGTIPCKVVKVNDEDAEIMLIEANAQARELSDREKLLQVQKLEILYQKKKDRGEKVPGRIQKHIAEKIGKSEASVGRMQKINNNLIEELKEKIDKGDLSISNANEFASLSANKQKIIKEILDENEKQFSKQKSEELKNRLKQLSDDEVSKLDVVDDIKKEFIKSTPNIVYTKELDLNDKIKKINNMILKLTKDLDEKNIINLEEGVDLLKEFESNTESLLLKIKEKRV